VASDHSSNQTGMRQMIQAAGFSVTLPGGIDQCQIAGVGCAEKMTFQCGGEYLRVAGANEPAACDRASRLNSTDGFVGSTKF
jgi:hypothetical protein